MADPIVLPLTFTADESEALGELILAVFGDDLTESERLTAAATAAKQELRQWLITRKIDLDQMMLAGRWQPVDDQQSVVARTEQFRDLAAEQATEAANEAARARALEEHARREAAWERGEELYPGNVQPEF